MQEKTARSAVAHAGIGISPARRTLGEGWLPMGYWLRNQCRGTQHGQSRAFRDWLAQSLAKPAA
jgi:hypothetical protein